MTVAELIVLLQAQQQDIHVTVDSCSEQCLLEERGITVFLACPPRPDGWVQDYRKDLPNQQYLNIGP